MFNTTLLGAGRVDQVHATNIASHSATTFWSMVDLSREFAMRLATQYQARQQSLDKAMTDPDVHVALIVSATDIRTDLIEMAARHGKAIFCEKSVYLDLARVRGYLKVVKEYGVPLFTGFNRRFGPQFHRVKTNTQAERIGKPESLLIISRDSPPPPMEYVHVSGGMFHDMTIYDFDMAHLTIDEEPVPVYAQGSNLMDPAIGEAGGIDIALTILKYASGAMVTIVNSCRSSYGYDQRLELHGSGGLLYAGNILENQVQHYGKQGCISTLPEHFFLQRYKSAYVAEWEHFVTVLRGEAVPDCDGDDGERALYLADKVLGSLRCQHEIVLQTQQPYTEGHNNEGTDLSRPNRHDIRDRHSRGRANCFQYAKPGHAV